MAVATLKKRREFISVRGGRRWSTPAFLLEGRQRKKPNSDREFSGDPKIPRPEQTFGPRFGFTITKKMGNAVVRNRIRRRLRAAIADLAPQFADPTFDYVVLARRPAFDRDFDQLSEDLRTAFRRIHGSPSRNKKPAGRCGP